MNVRRYAQFVTYYPKTVLGSFLALTFGALLLLSDLKVNPSAYVLPDHHPSRQALAKLQREYTGSKDAFLVVLEANKSIFNQKTLKRIYDLHQQFLAMTLIRHSDIEALKNLGKSLSPDAQSLIDALVTKGFHRYSWETLDELQDIMKEKGNLNKERQAFLDELRLKISPLLSVSSLSGSSNIKARGDTLDVSPTLKAPPKSAKEVALIAKETRGNPMFQDAIVSKDGRYAIFALELAIDPNDSFTQGLFYQRVQRVLEKEVPGPEAFYIAGFPVTSTVMANTIDHDANRLLPVVFFIVVFSLFLAFRSLKGMLVPISVVVFSLIWVWAAMAYFGIAIDVISVAMPVFILSIGVADGIHIYTDFREHLLSGKSREEAIIQTIDELFVPILLTSLTTATAFLILSITDVHQLYYVGKLVALGTIFAFLFSVAFMPALLVLWPQGSIKALRRTPIDRFVEKSLRVINEKSLAHARGLLVGSLLFALFLAYGASLVVVDNNPISFFKDDSEVVRSTKILDEKLSGSVYFNVLVRSSEEEANAMRKPENLEHLKALQNHLEKDPLVGKTVSPADLVQRIHFVLNDEDQAFNRLPRPQEMVDGEIVSGKDQVSRYLIMFGTDKSSIRDILNYDHNEANIKVILKTNSSKELSKIRDRIFSYIEKNFPDHLQVTVTGRAEINVATTEEIVASQIKGFLLSMGATILCLMLVFRSIKFGLIGTLPLFYTILCNFAMMGFMGITLNIGTALISSVVIGIGVDYSIHYISSIRKGLRRGLSTEKAIEYSSKTSGRAIFMNALTVAVGFLALLSSDFKPLMTLGWMIFVAMTLSAFCALVLIPALFKVTNNDERQTIEARASKEDCEAEIVNG